MAPVVTCDPDLMAAILVVLARATPQAPVAQDALLATLRQKRPGVPVIRIAEALAQLHVERRIGVCRVTRNGHTQDVYWPTGLKEPALVGLQPAAALVIQSNEDPMEKSETHGQKLIKIIVAHGPLIGVDLATRANLAAKSIDSYLATALKAGTICTRVGYVPELGAERKHYMTATQAEAWDARHEGHAMSHPDAVPAGDSMHEDLRNVTEERDGLLGLIGATGPSEAIAMIEARRAEMHDLKNEVAARTLIMAQLADIVGVENHEDILSAVERLTADRPAPTPGRLALLLIDSADLTEIEELPTNDDGEAHTRALATVEHGHAARVVVVRIQGEAVRSVTWKAAA